MLHTVGGMDPRREARALAAGCHVVVGTPGRIRDHVDRRNLDLSGVRFLVLDEGDEMLDMGFREELEAILAAAPEATVLGEGRNCIDRAQILQVFQNLIINAIQAIDEGPGTAADKIAGIFGFVFDVRRGLEGELVAFRPSLPPGVALHTSFDQTVNVGQTATFSVTASGTGERELRVALRTIRGALDAYKAGEYDIVLSDPGIEPRHAVLLWQAERGR